MGGRLDYPGRFGDLTVLRTIGDPGAYLAYLRTHGYPFTEGALIALLQRAIPLPPSLGALSPAQYYFAYDSYAWARTPGDGGTSDPFDPVALTDALDQRIVQPSRRAQALLDAQPTLTRLYTTLSPEDMTRDPVFAWNTDLPKVSRFAGATATIPCRGRTWVENDEGLRAYLTASTAGFPATLRLEVLGQEGPPTVLLDHRADLERMLEPIAVGDQTPQTSAPQSAGRGGCFGCAVETGGGAPVGPLLLFALSTAGLVIRRVRGRRLR